MKKPLLALLLLFSAAFLILLAVMPRDEASPAPVILNLPDTAAIPEGYLLLNEDNGEIIEVEREKFIAVTVALEMSPDAPQEALKAQAVAARSRTAAMIMNRFILFPPIIGFLTE